MKTSQQQNPWTLKRPEKIECGENYNCRYKMTNFSLLKSLFQFLKYFKVIAQSTFCLGYQNKLFVIHRKT
jgi:hypothetical protein